MEASKRVQQEASALRKQLGGRASSGGAGGGGVDPLEVPEQFRCPISQELMEDPVTTSDGQTYERREIFRWLCKHNTSPLTGAPLPNKTLTPAIALRQLIATFTVRSSTPFPCLASVSPRTSPPCVRQAKHPELVDAPPD